MLGTFWLPLGDNRLPDPMSLDVQLTYIAYVILANMVIMSLLTGLAGSVADRVVSRQLKDMIIMVERLEESIDVKTSLLLAAYPFRRAVHRWRYGKATSTTTASLVKTEENSKCSSKLGNSGEPLNKSNSRELNFSFSLLFRATINYYLDCHLWININSLSNIHFIVLHNS